MLPDENLEHVTTEHAEEVKALLEPYVSRTLVAAVLAGACACPVCLVRIAMSAGWHLAEAHTKRAADVAELERIASLGGGA